MYKEIIVDGTPVLIKEGERPPRIIRIRAKKRGRKRLRDIPYSKLSPQHKQAFDNVEVMGFDKKKQAAMYAGIPEHNALRTMDSLIVGRKSIVRKLEKLFQAKFGKGVSEKVAEAMVAMLDARYPLAKADRGKNLEILSAVKEINKIMGFYPPKKVGTREIEVSFD